MFLRTLNEASKRKDEKSGPKPRARQDAILELDVFLGSLEQKHVRTNSKGDVDASSDYGGAINTKLDDAGVRNTKPVRELKAADLGVVANKAI